MNIKLLAITTALASLSLAGCNSDSSSDDSAPDNSDGDNQTPNVSYTSKTVDASSHTEWAYFDLDSNSVVTEAEQWDLAFKRYEVILNTQVESALVASQNEFYDSEGVPNNTVFVNANVEDELEHLQAELDPDLTYQTGDANQAIGADGTNFYDYNPTNHRLYANDDAVWLIRSNTEQSYAKLRPVMLFDNDSGDSGAYVTAEFELFIQGENDNGFSSTAMSWTIDIPEGIGTGCFDIDSASSVGCDSDNWDIKFELNTSGFVFAITLNGGISGNGSAAAHGAFDAADTNKLISGIQESEEEEFNITQFHYSGDSQMSTFSENQWYAYNVNGRHQIWPNYRVYAVNTGETIYKVQLIGYYSDAAESGHISIRFEE